MTGIKSYKKILKQVKHKKAKAGRILRFNKPLPSNSGKSRKPCKRCGRYDGKITKYGLQLCRQCFRDVARKIGFKKYG